MSPPSWIGLKWCREGKEHFRNLSLNFWLNGMNFIISVPSNVTLSSKSPYLTARTKINYETGCIGRFLKKHRDVSWTTATARMELFEALVRSFHILTNFFFFYQGFLHRHWRFTEQQGKAGDHLFFHSTTSTRSRTLRHLFATLHVRWLSHF